MLSLEIDDEEAARVEPLIEYMIKNGMHLRVLGRWVHITKPVDWGLPKGDVEHLVKVSQSHTNYHCSMACSELFGMTDLSGAASVPGRVPSHLSLAA